MPTTVSLANRPVSRPTVAGQFSSLIPIGASAGVSALPASASTDRSRVLVAERAVGADRTKEAEDDDDGDDDPPGADGKCLQPIPGANRQALERGQVIGRQLHDERRGFALEERSFQHQPGEHGKPMPIR